MRPKEIDMHRLQDMVRLHRMGVGARQIARELQISPNTERRYRNALINQGLLQGEDELPSLAALRRAISFELAAETPAQEVSSIGAYQEKIKVLVKTGAGPTAIFDYLRTSDSEFDGTLSSVKRMVRQLRKAEGPKVHDVVVRVETAPGQIAQVDFGFVGQLFDPESKRLRKAYVFVMVLAHSRLMYADIVFDQTQKTWLTQHQQAFTFFNGVPHTVVPDNLKAAVIRTSFDNTEVPELNRTYRELARFYGFKIDPTPPYSPQLKGKVESGVKYVKSNFMTPRAFDSIDHARLELQKWLETVANARVHGTTGLVPRRHFEDVEHGVLMGLPTRPYLQIVWKKARVHSDSHVSFDRRLYSVPFRWIGQDVWVRAAGQTIEILAEDVVVATHSRGKNIRQTNRAHLPEVRSNWGHQSREWWAEKAHNIGPSTGHFIDAIFDCDEVLSHLRQVQSIVTLLEKYPAYRAEAASERAQAFGNYSYKGIKRILLDGLDMLPMEPSALFIHGRLEEPRFARTHIHHRGDE